MVITPKMATQLIRQIITGLHVVAKKARHRLTAWRPPRHSDLSVSAPAIRGPGQAGTRPVAYCDGVESLLHAAPTKASAIASPIPPARMYQGTRSFASSSSAMRVLAAGRSVQVALNP